MTKTIKGEFTVAMAPQDSGAAHGRLGLDKTYSGPLSGTGVGEMLTAVTETKGSQAYVAVEWVTGTVEGKAGSFALVHRGVMDRGTPALSVTIVPDSGTAALAGIMGSMTIEVVEGTHVYQLTYAFPSSS